MNSDCSAEAPFIITEDCKTELSLNSRERAYEEVGIIRTYGITATFTDTDGKRSEKAVNDISSVKENVEKIMNILAENKVSFYHLEDFIEDVLLEEVFI